MYFSIGYSQHLLWTHRQSSSTWILWSSPCCGQPFTAISQVNIADAPAWQSWLSPAWCHHCTGRELPSHQDDYNGVRDTLEVATPHNKTVKIEEVFTGLIKNHMKVTHWYYMDDSGMKQTLQARALGNFMTRQCSWSLVPKKFFPKSMDVYMGNYRLFVA